MQSLHVHSHMSKFAMWVHGSERTVCIWIPVPASAHMSVTMQPLHVHPLQWAACTLMWCCLTAPWGQHSVPTSFKAGWLHFPIVILCPACLWKHTKDAACRSFCALSEHAPLVLGHNINLWERTPNLTQTWVSCASPAVQEYHSAAVWKRFKTEDGSQLP